MNNNILNRNIIVIITGIIIMIALLNFEIYDDCDYKLYGSRFYNNGTECMDSGEQYIKFKNESNILEKCASIAKSMSSMLFGVNDDVCYINVKNNNKPCDVNGMGKVYRWSSIEGDVKKVGNNKHKLSEIESSVNFNTNYPPYINLGFITKNMFTDGNHSLIRVNRLLHKYGPQYGFNDDSPTDKLVNNAINFDGTSDQFYNNVIVGQKYDKLFKEALNVNIIKIKESNVINLVIGYLPTDKVDTILYKIAMKMKLAYQLDLDSDNIIPSMKGMIGQVLKRSGNSEKIGNMKKLWKLYTFNDLLLFKNIEFDKLFKQAFGIELVTIKETINLQQEKCEISRMINEDEKMEINDDTIILNKTSSSGHKWDKRQELDMEQYKMIDVIRCVDITGLMVDEDICYNEGVVKE
jgi:hypothetical protein